MFTKRVVGLSLLLAATAVGCKGEGTVDSSTERLQKAFAKCFQAPFRGSKVEPVEWDGKIPDFAPRRIAWAKSPIDTVGAWWLASAIDLDSAEVVFAVWLKVDQLDAFDRELNVRLGARSSAMLVSLPGDIRVDYSGTRPPVNIPVPPGVYANQVAAVMGADCGIRVVTKVQFDGAGRSNDPSTGPQGPSQQAASGR